MELVTCKQHQVRYIQVFEGWSAIKLIPVAAVTSNNLLWQEQ